MFKRVVFFILVISFALAGFYFAYKILDLGLIRVPASFPQLRPGIFGLGALVGLVAGLFLAPLVIRGAMLLTSFIEQYLQKTPVQDLLSGAIGLIFGLIIANLLRSILSVIGPLGMVAWFLLTVLLGYLSISIAVKKREEILTLFGNLARLGKEKGIKGDKRQSGYKILDTSVIIDGRIGDLCANGFLEGTLLVPGFVVEELRHIADSPDVLRRNRGRRGLDTLNEMRKNSLIKVQIYDRLRETERTGEVDSRLVKLAQRLGAKIITNDYNLNKVAELHGVGVLNINELANALKPVVLPGEEITVQVVKDGKEVGQGVAYLDDGTMVVIDGGRRYVGQIVTVQVTSVLQTAAGRMIFARMRQQGAEENVRFTMG